MVEKGGLVHVLAVYVVFRFCLKILVMLGGGGGILTGHFSAA